MKTLLRAVEFAPDDFESYKRLGAFHYDLGEYEKAAEERRTAAEEKRSKAEAERAERQARAEAERVAAAERAEIEKDPDRSVVPWLRPLGVTLDHARRADAYCQGLPNLAELTLEAKIKVALRFLGPPHGRAA